MLYVKIRLKRTYNNNNNLLISILDNEHIKNESMTFFLC